MSLLPGFIKKPLGCLLSILASLLLLVLVLVVVGSLVVDYFAINIAGHELKQRSGFTLTAGSQDIGVLHGNFDVKDLELTNPDRFAAKDFVKFNEIQTSVEVSTMLSKRVVVDEIVVDLESLAIVQNKDGEDNFAALQNSLMGATAPADATKKSKTPGIPPFTIKKLTLSVHGAKYFNFKTGDGKPAIYNLNYTRKFTDVNETNLFSVELAIGRDLDGKGFGIFSEILKDKILDHDTYLDAAKGITNLVGNATGAVLGGAGIALDGAGSLVKKVIP